MRYACGGEVEIVGSGATNQDRLKDVNRLFVLKPHVTSRGITEIVTVICFYLFLIKCEFILPKRTLLYTEASGQEATTTKKKLKSCRN